MGKARKAINENPGLTALVSLLAGVGILTQLKDAFHEFKEFYHNYEAAFAFVMAAGVIYCLYVISIRITNLGIRLDTHAEKDAKLVKQVAAIHKHLGIKEEDLK